MTLLQRFKKACLGFTLLLLVGCNDTVLFPPDAILPNGGVYHGDIDNGVFHGQGEIHYPNGVRYTGEFANGIYSGQGAYFFKNGSSYVGDFQLGAATGNTVYTTASGDTKYVGEIKEWEFDGFGKLTNTDSVYSGEFQNNKYHGLGQIEYQTGAGYSGQFKNDEFSGQGVYQQGGITYEGTFVDGEFTGKGTITYEDGAVYIGDIVQWSASGEGQKKDAQGNLIIGLFESGYAQGEGRFIGVDDQQYDGSFSYDQFDGQGKLVRSDQSVYTGEFSYGRFHGEGELITPALDGQPASVKKGRWRNGNLVFNSVTGEYREGQAEVALEQHQLLLNQSIDQLAVGNKNTPNAYFLGLAGDGTQSVFRREIEFVSEQINQRYGTEKRSILLVNHHDSAAIYPLATTRSFAKAVDAIAEHMDKQADVLFVYLSSHGSSQHALTLDHDSIDLPPISAESIGTALRTSGIKWKVVFISACYAGGFVPELDDGNTLILTAADSENTSFGCSEDSEMTFFGKALFKEVLAEDAEISLPAAFIKAVSLIEQWESEQDFTSSNPTITKPAAILRQLSTLNVKN